MSAARLARLSGLVAAAAVGALLVAGCGDDGAGVRVSPSTTSRPTSAGPLTSTPPGAETLARCPRSTSEPAPDGGLPDVTLQCLGEGPDVLMAGLRGRPRLVNVWASWCLPCRSEMPLLQDAYERGVDVLGVDAEDLPASAGALVAELGVRYPSVFDPGNEFGSGMGITSKPITVFVDADGVVVHTQIGGFDSAEQLRALVAEYLGVTLR